MNIFTWIQKIWHIIAGISGNVVTSTLLISLVLFFIEKYRYYNKRKKPAREAISPHSYDGKATVPTSRKIAIITGASSGLGRKYAMAIDKNPAKYDVTEFWLIARRRERLEALAENLHLPVKILCLDLTESENLDSFEELLKLEASSSPEPSSFSVTMLLNCAGYGKYGSSSEIGRKEECRMIDTNDKAAISVTASVSPYMRAGSRILEICSVAGFQPIPFFNCYAASKSLLYSYSRGLRIELLKTGISVTAVCPYWIKDTEFIAKAAGRQKKLFLTSNASRVVRISLFDAQHRHALSTPGILCTLDRIFAGWIPDEVLAYIMTFFL